MPDEPSFDVDDAVQHLEGLGHHVDQWQRHILKALANPVKPADMFEVIVSQRRHERLMRQRLWLAAHVAAGDHVHVIEAGGRQICYGGDCTPEQLVPASERPRAGMPQRIYDEWDPDVVVDESWSWSAANPLPELLRSRISCQDAYLEWHSIAGEDRDAD